MATKKLEPTDWITLGEAAELMGRNHSWVWKLATRGDLVSKKFGAQNVVSKQSVLDYQPKPRGNKSGKPRVTGNRSQRKEKIAA